MGASVGVSVGCVLIRMSVGCILIHMSVGCVLVCICASVGFTPFAPTVPYGRIQLVKIASKKTIFNRTQK